MATLAHLLGVITGFVGPLVIYLVARSDQRFAKQHAADAVNFQLTALLAMLVACVLWVAGMFLSLASGFFVLAMLPLPFLVITVVVVPALSAGAAYRGERQRNRFVIPFVTA